MTVHHVTNQNWLQINLSAVIVKDRIIS